MYGISLHPPANATNRQNPLLEKLAAAEDDFNLLMIVVAVAGYFRPDISLQTQPA